MPRLSPENGDLVILFYQKSRNPIFTLEQDTYMQNLQRNKKRENSVIIYSFVVPNQFRKYMSEHPPKILMEKHEGEQIMTEFSIWGELFLRSGGLSL